jgi:hypothetical protein
MESQKLVSVAKEKGLLFLASLQPRWQFGSLVGRFFLPWFEKNQTVWPYQQTDRRGEIAEFRQFPWTRERDARRGELRKPSEASRGKKGIPKVWHR